MAGKPQTQPRPSPAPRGPREERGVTLARITEAARDSFAQNGWGGTTMRGVARAAGVDPALVHYYFSSKEELLDASTTPPVEWIVAVQEAQRGPVGSRGEAIVRALISSWSQPAIREALSSILQTAAQEPRTREKIRVLITTAILPAIADRLDDQERALRAALVASQVLGLLMMRYVWQIEPLTSLPEDDVVALVAPTLQRYLSGRLRPR
jgi:AcrR family transcriptional regulator